jgi:hypothetical protein
MHPIRDDESRYVYGENMNKVAAVLLLFISLGSYAGDIGFGTVEGIKIYDFSNDESIRVFLSSTSTHVNADCIVGSMVVGKISKVKHDQSVIDRMMSMVLTANISEKKVRLHSATNSCEIDFVAIQKSYY